MTGEDLVRAAAGLVAGYLLATLAESFLHQHVQHAGPRFRRLQRRYPRLLGAFARAYYSHHVVHHHLTFRRDYARQFADPDDQHETDARIERHRRGYLRRIRAERYGLTLGGVGGYAMFVAPVVPAVTAIYLALGPAAAAAALLPLVVVYPLASEVVHPLLHRRLAEHPPGWAGWVGRWVCRRRVVRYVLMHHFVHHRDPGVNFNPLPGGDFLRGVGRRPTAAECAAMAALGVIEPQPAASGGRGEA
jgi:hypothetical protein